MRIVHTIADLRAARRELNTDIGFVPTMGALHDGHISLVKRAKAECGSAIASIFVNPTQFNDKADFTRYPRTLENDARLLEPAGCDVIFAPDAQEMYPQGFDTRIDIGSVTTQLEGAMRPGHFAGVATVVAKLFNIVQPARAYFGQKDAQQVVVVRKLVADLNMPLEIVAAPTLREADGLAMSSRNVHLTAAERAAAPVVYQALQAVKAAYEAGERDGETLRAIAKQKLSHEPLAIVEYVSVANPRTLDELDGVAHDALVSLAARFGKTRLIDNIVLG
ncbi:MAG: pantoate--beta-alanine ligase [Caulobacterales bacterium]